MTQKQIRIYRAPHDNQNPYFMMRRDTAQDRRLSFEGRGLLAYLLSKPDDWVIAREDLMREGGIGRDKVVKLLKELVATGYAERLGQIHADSGKWAGVDYAIHESPMTEKAFTVEPSTVNPPLQNTEKNKIQKKNHASAKANAGAGKEKTPAQKLYDAILEVWGYQAGLNGDMAKMLTGKATKKAFKPYNLPADQPVTAEELLAWAKAWKTAHPGLDMLAERGKVQSAILNWRAAQAAVTSGNASAVDHDDFQTVEMTINRFTPFAGGDNGRGTT